MIINDSIKIANYKCFGKTPQGFERLMPINIIIGKNNSGKSTLVELIRHVVEGNKFILPSNSNSIDAPVIKISSSITAEAVNEVFPDAAFGGQGPLAGRGHLAYGETLVGSKVEYSFNQTKGKENERWERVEFEGVNKYNRRLLNEIKPPFYESEFSSISAERDIRAEGIQNMSLHSNGVNATSIIHQIFTLSKYNTQIIKKDLLEGVNNIVMPDIVFKEIVPQAHEGNIWEIYFEDENNNLIALSKMGSGIKTILLVLLNTIVKPKFEGRKENNYVFAFEELENNLHPSLLRRLFNYIADYSAKNNAYFFITTHSSIVIDMFSNNENAQILHVHKKDKETIVSTVSTSADSKNIIKDLDVRASDLLLSNGVVWVEGPSDRIYINKWLSILAPELKEGLHYIIMFYGGRLLSNLSFNSDWLEKEFIPLLKVNHNAFVVMDKDGKTSSADINTTKKRIQEEIGESNCWITEGREIENYLSDNLIKRWLKNRYSQDVVVAMEQHTSFDDILEGSGVVFKYSKDKKGYSTEIAEQIENDDLEILDLKNRIYQLVTRIKEWNLLA